MSELAIIFISYFVATLAFWLAHYFLLRRSSSEEKSKNQINGIVRGKAEIVRGKAEIVQNNPGIVRGKAEVDPNDTKQVEFHVLVNPTKPKLYEKLIQWVETDFKDLQRRGFLRARIFATRTKVGVSGFQGMFTCVMEMTADEDIQQRLNEIMHMVEQVLASTSDVDQKTNIDVEEVEDTGYIEAHMKIRNIKTKKEWIKLARFCAKFRIVLLSNFESRNSPGPTTTYREYETNIETFTRNHDRIIQAFREEGYQMDKVHTEISPKGCDTEPCTDIDWAIFQRFEGAWKQYMSGRMTFNECFRWIEESDFTEESFNPPEGWEEEMQKWLLSHPTLN